MKTSPLFLSFLLVLGNAYGEPSSKVCADAEVEIILVGSAHVPAEEVFRKKLFELARNEVVVFAIEGHPFEADLGKDYRNSYGLEKSGPNIFPIGLLLMRSYGQLLQAVYSPRDAGFLHRIETAAKAHNRFKILMLDAMANDERARELFQSHRDEFPGVDAILTKIDFFETVGKDLLIMAGPYGAIVTDAFVGKVFRLNMAAEKEWYFWAKRFVEDTKDRLGKLSPDEELSLESFLKDPLAKDAKLHMDKFLIDLRNRTIVATLSKLCQIADKALRPLVVSIGARHVAGLSEGVAFTKVFGALTPRELAEDDMAGSPRVIRELKAAEAYLATLSR